MAKSIEEQVEGYYKNLLKSLGVRYYAKTEEINSKITEALKNSVSKGGGSGMNYPDIKLLLENSTRRDIPVMIEVKGTRGKLEKLDKNGEIVGVTPWASDGKVGKDGKLTHAKGDPNYNVVKGFAVNGAMHYGSAVLDGGYDEVIIVGVNGCELKDGQVINPECKAYYVSKKNNYIPKLISEITAEDWSLFAHVDSLFERLDQLNLSEAEIEALTNKTEAMLEEKIKRIHQSLYDDVQLKTALTTNEKLYLFCGLITAGLKTDGVRTLDVNDLHSNNTEDDIDWSYMESTIRELDAYLKETGLDDYRLTEAEQRLLEREPTFKEFEVGALFDVTQGRRLKKSDFEDGDIPFVMASSRNNGVVAHLSNPVTTNENFITADILGNVFYHDGLVGFGDDNCGLKLKNGKESETIYLYLVGVLSCFKSIASYGNKLRGKWYQEQLISLPVKEGTDDANYTEADIDWDYMAFYTRAMEKQVIADVVDYKNEVIARTKELVEK